MRSMSLFALVVVTVAGAPLAASAGDPVYVSQSHGNVLGAAFDGLSGRLGNTSPFSAALEPLVAPSVGSIAGAYQYGSRNTANLDVHAGNAARSEQVGADNTTNIHAGGSGNVVNALQLGIGNLSDLATTGTGNSLFQTQIGNFNTADITLANIGTTLIQTQIGSGLHFDLSQIGTLPDGRVIIVTQTRNP